MPRNAGAGPWRTTTARTGGMAIGAALGMVLMWGLKETGVVTTVPNEIAVAVGSLCSWLVDWVNARS